MSNAINFPSARQMVLNDDGTFVRSWFLFFQVVYDRIGGAIAPSNNEIDSSLFEDAGSSEVVAMLNDMRQQFSLSPSMPEMSVQIDALTSENTSLREQVLELQRAVQAIQQSILTS